MREDSSARASLPPRDFPPRTEGNLATAPDWQSEVSHRLQSYRAKRRRLQGDNSEPEFQPTLSFEKAALAFENRTSSFEAERSEFSFEKIVLAEEEHAASPVAAPPKAAPTPAPAVRTRSSRPKNTDRFEIDISQPAFDFNAAERLRGHSPEAAAPPSRPQLNHASPAHVASLSVRRHAGLIDAALLVFAFGSFWSLFSALGGHFSLSSFSAIVTVATLSLLYAQYFTLFTYFGGSTPGMMLCHLRVVSFDGSEPTSQQLLWRSFGYLISAGSGALGFIWSLWDEEHLSWQDRISHTYLTESLDAPYRDDGGSRPASHDAHMAGRHSG